MLKLPLVAIAAAVSFAPALPAQTPTNFRPLEFLVGHCWVGAFPGGKVTDEHCFEWVFDRKFVRDKHVVRGGEPYEGESLYAWDPKAKRISFSYWSSAGQLTTGTVEETPEGLVFPQKLESAAGTVEMKSVWTRPDAESYRVSVGEKKGAEWKVLWTMDLKRKS